jgi:hypothetical protein
MNPRVFKKSGLKHLDRVVDLVSSHNGRSVADHVQCAAHGIYTVIDLHALPGGKHRQEIRVLSRRGAGADRNRAEY